MSYQSNTFHQFNNEIVGFHQNFLEFHFETLERRNRETERERRICKSISTNGSHFQELGAFLFFEMRDRARATKKIRITARSPFFGTGQPSHTYASSIYLPWLPTCCPHAATEANLDNPRSPESTNLLSSVRQTRVPYVSTKDRC